MFYKIYHDTIPPYLLEIMNTNIFTRLKDIGMNCGMEYTQFQTFKNSFEFQDMIIVLAFL